MPTKADGPSHHVCSSYRRSCLMNWGTDGLVGGLPGGIGRLHFMWVPAVWPKEEQPIKKWLDVCHVRLPFWKDPEDSAMLLINNSRKDNLVKVLFLSFLFTPVPRQKPIMCKYSHLNSNQSRSLPLILSSQRKQKNISYWYHQRSKSETSLFTQLTIRLEIIKKIRDGDQTRKTEKRVR